MYRTLALLVVSSSLLVSATGCGGQKRCTEKTPASFATFLDEEWRVYCAEYTAHVESPQNYELPALAKFFAAHPSRVSNLTKSLYGHKRYESCFSAPREELELRDLQSCLQNNDASDHQMVTALTTAAKPWLDDLMLQQNAVSPKAATAEAEAERLQQKVEFAFNRSTRPEGDDWIAFKARVAEIGASLDAIEGAPAVYEEIRANAAGHAPLARAVESNLGGPISTLGASVASLRERHASLATEASFIEYAWNAAGVRCPASARGASSELSAARKVVAGRNNEVGGTGPRVSGKAKSESDGETDTEQIEGFVCGTRAPASQFEGKPQLCGQFRFVLEREKPSEERRWGDWTLQSFEESGPEGGIDCKLKK